VKHYKTRACKSCPVKSICTRNKNGRLIERSQYAQAVEPIHNALPQKKKNMHYASKSLNILSASSSDSGGMIMCCSKANKKLKRSSD
jgi:hypothetical protein